MPSRTGTITIEMRSSLNMPCWAAALLASSLPHHLREDRSRFGGCAGGSVASVVRRGWRTLAVPPARGPPKASVRGAWGRHTQYLAASNHIALCLNELLSKKLRRKTPQSKAYPQYRRSGNSGYFVGGNRVAPSREKDEPPSASGLGSSRQMAASPHEGDDHAFRIPLDPMV